MFRKNDSCTCRKYILGIDTLVPMSVIVIIQGKDESKNKSNLCIVCVATLLRIMTVDVMVVMILLPSPF